VRRGLDLFQGVARFSAGGPACNACHNVVNDAVVGGGALAADLTESFGRAGAEGVTAMLPRKDTPSPFPVMQAAFQGHPLTDEESQALVAFLQDANARHGTQKANDLGPKMLATGVGGVVVLMLLFAFLGRGRKRKSVNQAIYDRQTVGG
jgi:cytochrome c1